MNTKAKNTLITYVVGLSLATFVGVAQADDMEKCYGVAKAGMNDCEDTNATCDKSVIDADPNYFLNVPKGMCNKLVGGMLMNPGASMPSMPSATTTPSTTTTTTTTTPSSSMMPSTTTTPDSTMPTAPSSTTSTTTTSTTTGGAMGSGSTGGSTSGSSTGTGTTSGY